MDFALSDEQVALGESERAWLAKNDPIAARRPGIDDGPARLPADGLRHLAHSGLIGLLTTENIGELVMIREAIKSRRSRMQSAEPVTPPE